MRICHFQGFVTRELIASGDPLEVGPSVTAAPNYRSVSEFSSLTYFFLVIYNTLRWNQLHYCRCTLPDEEILTFLCLLVSISSRFLRHVHLFQTRSRSMVVYAQFGGNPCGGQRTETRPCETTKSCPLQDGCGDRFRCRSGWKQNSLPFPWSCRSEMNDR